MLTNIAKRRILVLQSHFVRAFSGEVALKEFATVNPERLTARTKLQNLCNGEWTGTQEWDNLIDPLNGKIMGKVPHPTNANGELKPFIDSLKECPKSGLHNPLKNPERYLLYGQVCKKAADLLEDKTVSDFFVRLMQRVVPKSYAQ